MKLFWILNIAAAALLVAGLWTGLLTPIVAGPAAPGVVAILALLLIALAARWLYLRHLPAPGEGYPEDYSWYWRVFAFGRQHITTVGLVGTVIGLILAMTHAQFQGDAATVMGSLARGIGLALGSTVTGLVGYLWLELMGELE